MNFARVVEAELVRPSQGLAAPGCLLVRLRSERGSVGVGEAGRGAAVDLAEALQWVSSVALGARTVDRQAVWQAAVGSAADWDGDSAAIAGVLCGLDMAMWDLAARELGVPAGVLMGGRARRRLEVCVDCGPVEDSAVLDAASGLMKQGVRSFCLEADPGDADLPDHLRRTRRVLGVEALLALRVATPAQTVQAAIAAGQALDRAEPFWVEGLLPEGQWAELAKVRSAIASPTAAGRDTLGVRRFQRILESGCADVVMAQPGNCAGPTGTLRLADMTDTRGLRMALAVGESLVSVLAGLHVCFARANVSPLCVALPTYEAAVGALPQLFADGFALPPENVGLGLEAQEQWEVIATFPDGG